MKTPGWGSVIRAKALYIVLVIAILGVLGTLGYMISMSSGGEPFTEFYILGVNGEATDYPKEIRAGEEARVIVGIINRENEAVNYRVEIRINGVKNNEVGSITLVDEQKWETVTSFTPTAAGENQKVEFLLYKNRGVEPYLKPLYLWINAK